MSYHMGFRLHDLFHLVAPSNLLVLGLVVSLIGVWRKRRWGTAILAGCTAIAVIVSIWPVGGWMMAPLEHRFPVLKPMPEHVDGIVVLGGAVRLTWSYRVGLPSLNKHAERMTEAVALAHRYPNARIVFTGGNRTRISESDVARLFFSEQGIDLSRVTFEDKSHSTYDNAVLTKTLVDPKPREIWLMVTSAAHMPRAMGAFRKAGWHIVPYPVDFDEPWSFRPSMGLAMGDHIHKLDDAVREWTALAVYYIRGWTDALIPAPWNGQLAGEQSTQK